MTPHTYLLVVAAASAPVGLWIALRLARFAPTGTRGATVCLIAAVFVPDLATPAAHALANRAPDGISLLLAVFPVLVVTFTLAAWALRYFADLIQHASR